MITVLLAIICLFALWRYHHAGLAFALAHTSMKVFCDKYTTPEFIHSLAEPYQGEIVSLGFTYVDFCYDTAESLYYIASGCFDFVLIMVIALVIRYSTTGKFFMLLSLACLFVNFVGWSLWFAGVSQIFYNSAFVVLYSIAILLFLRKDSAKNERRIDIHNGCGVFPLANCKSLAFCKTLHGERKETGH